LIDTLGIVSTQFEVCHFQAFINVPAVSVGIESEAFGADAESCVPGSSDDAFLIRRTGMGGRAISTHHDAVVPFPNVGRITSAMFSMMGIIDTQRVSRALIVLATSHHIGIANSVRVSSESGRTIAYETAIKIGTEGVHSTGRGTQFNALIDVSTCFSVLVSHISSSTDTLVGTTG